MRDDDGLLTQTLRARGSQIFLRQDIEQARADLTEVECGARGSEGDRRQYQPLQILERIGREVGVAAGRKDAKHEAEDEDQHDPEVEVRERHAGDRHAGCDEVDDRVPPHGGDRPDDECDHDRQKKRGSAELQSLREPLGDRLEHRLASAKRAAEVTLKGVLEPDDVLGRKGLVESVLLTDRCDNDGVLHLAAGEDRHRVARRQMNEHEDDDAYEERDGNH